MRIETITIWTTCPYCDTHLDYDAKRGMQIIYCDSERGGCGAHYVAEVDIVPKVFIYKIDGTPEQEEQ